MAAPAHPCARGTRESIHSVVTVYAVGDGFAYQTKELVVAVLCAAASKLVDAGSAAVGVADAGAVAYGIVTVAGDATVAVGYRLQAVEYIVAVVRDYGTATGRGYAELGTVACGVVLVAQGGAIGLNFFD